MSGPGPRANEGPDPASPGASERRESPAGSRERRPGVEAAGAEHPAPERLGVEEVVVPVLAERLKKRR